MPQQRNSARTIYARSLSGVWEWMSEEEAANVRRVRDGQTGQDVLPRSYWNEYQAADQERRDLQQQLESEKEKTHELAQQVNELRGARDDLLEANTLLNSKIRSVSLAAGKSDKSLVSLAMSYWDLHRAARGVYDMVPNGPERIALWTALTDMKGPIDQEDLEWAAGVLREAYRETTST